MLAWPAYPAEVSPRHWRNTRPGQHIQQRCHPDIGGMQGLASISSRGVTQTLEEYKAWSAYPAEVSPRHWRSTRPGQHIQQRSHPDIGGIRGLASISSRGITQALEEQKAWPAYPAEMSPKRWRNARPDQHMQQRCHPDIEGLRGLASISSRSVSHTLEECRAWPAYPAEVSPRHWRNTRPGRHIQQRCRPNVGGIQGLAL